MTALLNSFLLVFASEMGDKTQLLSLVLAARFRKPLPIMMGILVATLLNHALASYLGSVLTGLVSEEVLRWGLAAIFILFGLWILIPDKNEDLKGSRDWGPFSTTLVAFFLAEMGDKTQLATVALGARYQDALLVTAGTTLGMLGADGLAVYFGNRFTDRIPMLWVRRFASLLFIVFGLALLF